jgi:hypothetical protein
MTYEPKLWLRIRFAENNDSTNFNNFEENRVEDAPSTQQQTTTFNTDADVVVSTVRHPMSVGQMIKETAQSGSIQSILSFLQKPIRLISGNLSTTDTATTFSQIELPSGILNNNIYRDKLNGHLAFRATIVLTININATRFQQGRYMIYWVPSGGANGGTARSTSWFTGHTASLVQRTQLPHVEFDVSCDTQATLEIPFVSAYPYYSLRSYSADTSIGTAVLAPYSPLRVTSGLTTAGYTIWAYFKDVEVVTPTFPQMGGFNRSGTVTKRSSNPSELEQDGTGIGPVTSFLKKSAKASSLLGNIPLLSSFTAPVSWALDLSSQVASVFGWSKPTNLEHTAKVQRRYWDFVGNVDNVDSSRPLALNTTNIIEHVDGFSGTDLDELSFEYLTSISSWFESFDWSTLNAADALLDTVHMTPDTFYTTNGSFFNLTPVCFIAQFFDCYRGSFNLTIKIVKTEFHSGRLGVVFVPHDPRTTSPTFSVSSSDYAFREIIDIRYGSEFTFNFPFTSLESYRHCRSSASRYGTVFIYIVDPLRAPDTVSNTVAVLLEVSGGKDLEYAVPVSLPMLPIMNVVPQMDPCALTGGTIGNSTSSGGDYHSRACIGEKIISFRSLIKRYELTSFLTGDPLSVAPVNTTVLFPYHCKVGLQTAGAAEAPLVAPDLIDLLMSCFALSRGSLRIKYLPPANDLGTPGRWATYLVPQPATTGDIPTFITFSGASETTRIREGKVWSCQAQEGGIEFQVPFYHRLHSVANSDLCTNGRLSYQLRSINTTYVRHATVTYFPSATLPRFARAAGDDFNLGTFISIPPIAYYSNSGRQ